MLGIIGGNTKSNGKPICESSALQCNLIGLLILNDASYHLEKVYVLFEKTKNNYRQPSLHRKTFRSSEIR